MLMQSKTPMHWCTKKYINEYEKKSSIERNKMTFTIIQERNSYPTIQNNCF